MKTATYWHDRPLPYPTRRIKAEGGDVEAYVIPEDKKGEVLKALYPFIPVPSLDAEMLDIHEDKTLWGEHKMPNSGYLILQCSVCYQGANLAP